MALFIRQSEDRSKLQERLAAELREKAKQTQQASDGKQPDGVRDSKYLEDTKETTSLAWVWVAIIVFVIVAFIVYLVGSL